MITRSPPKCHDCALVQKNRKMRIKGIRKFWMYSGETIWFRDYVFQGPCGPGTMWSRDCAWSASRSRCACSHEVTGLSLGLGLCVRTKMLEALFVMIIKFSLTNIIMSMASIGHLPPAYLHTLPPHLCRLPGSFLCQSYCF